MISKLKGILQITVLCVLSNTAVTATQNNEDRAPEAATGTRTQTLVTSKNFMIVTANPLATRAGYDMLEQGGTAADAAIATQLVLNLVEPQSSGIGGGAFTVYYDAGAQRLTTLDGRETAPLTATATLFQNANGQPQKFYDAVVGGKSVGTPGTVRLLEKLHEQYGRLPWATLFEPAIKLAYDGFKVSPRLAKLIDKDQQRLKRFSGARQYFFHNNGSPLQEGDLLKNPEFASTLQAIATDGASAFYSGRIARDIVSTVQSAAGSPGKLTLKDLASYRVIERKPVCSAYRQYNVCGMGPPSSGALTLGQILGMLNHFDLARTGADNAESWRLIGDASRLAFSDRARYMADDDFVPVPVAGLIDRHYLARRSKLLRNSVALESVSAGQPAPVQADIQSDDQSIEFPSTSHISIADAYGNALSMTTTIENGFGSRLMTNGFLLNNELTDFSFVAEKDGMPIANRIQPGKRPRSSMAPTIVMDRANKPYLILGSPGGSRIIGYVAKALIAHIDWGMTIQEAINYPNLVNRTGVFDIELGSSAEAMKPDLEKLGYKVRVRELNSGLHGIVISQQGYMGGADPRREGLGMGE